MFSPTLAVLVDIKYLPISFSCKSNADLFFLIAVFRLDCLISF